MFILLPLSDEGLPDTKEKKHEIIRTILDAALQIGMHKEDIVVDGLVATVGANPKAAIETLETIQYCKDELKLLTSCGLSNISFGLPKRINVNTAFLTMAIQCGLTMAIANPNQEMLMSAAAATDLLLHKDGADLIYINRMNDIIEQEEAMREAGLLPEHAAGVRRAERDLRLLGSRVQRGCEFLGKGFSRPEHPHPAPQTAGADRAERDVPSERSADRLREGYHLYPGRCRRPGGDEAGCRDRWPQGAGGHRHKDPDLSGQAGL